MATAAALPTLVPVLLRGYVNSDVVPSIPFVQMNKIIPVVLRFSSAKLLLVTTLNVARHGVTLTNRAGAEAPLRPPKRAQKCGRGKRILAGSRGERAINEGGSGTT